MLTEDISLPINGSWLLVPLTTTQTIIFNNNNGDLLVRFGALSLSSGFKLSTNDTIACSEAVYVKPSIKYSSQDEPMTINVTR